MKNLQAIFMVSDNMTNKKKRILNDSPQRKDAGIYRFFQVVTDQVS